MKNQDEFAVQDIVAIQKHIISIRNVHAILDRDLAVMYDVEVKHLNRQVKRNIERFPADFMFQLTKEECTRCQIGTLYERGEKSLNWSTYRPYVFTENGVAMLSGVLRSPIAVAVNIGIMRAFTAMRRFVSDHAGLVQRVGAIELKQLETDKRIDTVFDALDRGNLLPSGRLQSCWQLFRKFEWFASGALNRQGGYDTIVISKTTFMDRKELNMTNGKKSTIALVVCAAAVFVAGAAFANDIAKYDKNMAVEGIVVTNGIKWVDGKLLPIEGRAFNDVEHYYDRLPAGVTTNVNGGVRSMKHHTSGMQFRFVTDSKKLSFKWVPYNQSLAMDHMPASGVSGIDVYRFDAKSGRWLYVKTGRITNAKGAQMQIPWTPGTPCLVNLPLYNGVKEFSLGVEPDATVSALGPRKSGVDKPVVFYGTSITHGGCCSRPGLAFVNIVGRDLDVPVVNLGFSGSGVMEFEMSEHLARIDASCYVLDCLWNMVSLSSGVRNGRSVEENYEPFIRNLRAKRPDVPIVMAEMCDVYCGGKNAKDKYIKQLYDKLVAEGWKNLVYLPKDDMYTGDLEGTVDGCHPNDWGMMSLARAFGGAVRKALGL